MWRKSRRPGRSYSRQLLVVRRAARALEFEGHLLRCMGAGRDVPHGLLLGQPGFLALRNLLCAASLLERPASLGLPSAEESGSMSWPISPGPSTNES